MIAGRIQNPERAVQLKDYSKLRYKNITPGDIDGFFEIRGDVFVLLEYKGCGVNLSHGQRQAFERLADIIPKPSLLIIAEHSTAASEQIQCHSCNVREFRFQRRWYPGGKHTVRALIDKFLLKNGLADWVHGGTK